MICKYLAESRLQGGIVDPDASHLPSSAGAWVVATDDGVDISKLSVSTSGVLVLSVGLAVEPLLDMAVTVDSGE